MSVAIRCPHCSKRFGVSEEALGHTMTCPNCKVRFEAVDESTLPAAGQDAQALRLAPEEAPAARRAPVQASLAGDKPEDGGKGRKTGTKSVEGVDVSHKDGVWTAEVSWERLARSPGIYLSGIAIFYGLLTLVGLGFYNPLTLFVMGIVGFVGWWLAYGDYYHKWTDFGDRELLLDQAPSPWWLHACMFAPIATLVIAGMLTSFSDTSRRMRHEAYLRYAQRGDEKEVREGVDRFHDDCFKAAYEEKFNKSSFNKGKYWVLMDARVTFPKDPARTPGPIASDLIMDIPGVQIRSAPFQMPSREPIVPPHVPNPRRPVLPDPAPVTRQPAPDPARPTPDPPQPVPTPSLPKTETRDPDPVKAALADASSGQFLKIHNGLKALGSLPVREEHRPVVAQQLEKLLDDKTISKGLKSMLVEALERWKTDDTAMALATRLKQTADQVERFSMYQALERLKDPRTAPIVAGQFHGEDGAFATRVLEALGADAEDAVLLLLRNTEPALQRQTCRMLGKIGTAKSLPALEALVAGPDGVMRATAKAAITKIKERK